MQANRRLDQPTKPEIGNQQTNQSLNSNTQCLIVVDTLRFALPLILMKVGAWEASVERADAIDTCAVTVIPAGPGMLAMSISSDRPSLMLLSLVNFSWKLRLDEIVDVTISFPRSLPLNYAMRGDGVHLSGVLSRVDAVKLAVQMAVNREMTIAFGGGDKPTWQLPTTETDPILRRFSLCLRERGMSAQETSR